ncbi:MAG: DUF1616 domain-containing protein [Candidatus Bathyarchaeia archaeon]
MGRKRVSEALKEFIVETIKREKPKNVAHLIELVIGEGKAASEEDVIESIRDLKGEGIVELELLPPEVSSFKDYLKVGGESAWFYLTILAVVSTLSSIYLLPGTYPLVVIRWILGSLFVLYLPGYVVIQSLFSSRGDLDDIERFALSIGLSLAITPLMGLLLNYTPWGIRLDPVVVSLTLFTLALAVIAVYRKYRLAPKKLGGRE